MRFQFSAAILIAATMSVVVRTGMFDEKLQSAKEN